MNIYKVNSKFDEIDIEPFLLYSPTLPCNLYSNVQDSQGKCVDKDVSQSSGWNLRKQMLEHFFFKSD